MVQKYTTSTVEGTEDPVRFPILVTLIVQINSTITKIKNQKEEKNEIIFFQIK